MPLTPNQQRVVNALPSSQRTTKARFFLQQNANRDASTGNKMPTVNTQVTRLPVFPTRRSNPQRQTRPTINTPSHVFTATGILRTLASTTSDFNIYTIPVNPQYIQSLTQTAYMFSQWRYTNYSVRFMSTSPATTPGLVFYAIVPYSSLVPAKFTEVQAIPGLVCTSTHTNGTPITPPVPNRNKWFDTALASAIVPGQFIYGHYLPPANSAIGYFAISYTIEFRYPQNAQIPKAIATNDLNDSIELEPSVSEIDRLTQELQAANDHIDYLKSAGYIDSQIANRKFKEDEA